LITSLLGSPNSPVSRAQKHSKGILDNFTLHSWVVPTLHELHSKGIHLKLSINENKISMAKK
jgi:hypothetical protein